MARFFNRFWISFFLLVQIGCFPKKTGIKNKQSPSDKVEEVLLVNGAGASFPYILYLKWFSEYRRLKPEVAINYQSIGSGGGIRQFLKGTLDFGATDVPVSDKDVKKEEKQKIVHIPTALGAVAVTYNLNLKEGEVLQLGGKVLSDIFQGKITKWNHSSIQELNKNISLPDEPIITVYRADGSGTTAFFTEFLSQRSAEFLKKIGKGKSVQWPVGVGGKGNEGVVGLVNKMKGAIGYISASYAVVQKIPVAKIRNKSGSFISPTTKAIMAAADSAMTENKDYLASLINSSGEKSYPLSGFTYIILSRIMPEKKGRILVEFLNWALDDGQGFSEALNFNPLPESVRQAARKKLSEVQFQ